MKKHILVLSIFLSGILNAQSTRTCLYEYFCGETCPPCATTAPPLYALLSSPTNTPKIISIEWETPIPSAPSNTWSLYQTNKIECDWRYRTSAAGGYGYYPSISYVPFGKIDGQSQSVFGAVGAYSDHAVNLTNTIIATAQSYTTPFSINMSRAWDSTASSVNVTVNINASANFNAVGNLRFRLVMIEREIHFPIQPGTNGQKDFENVAIKSFPNIQQGTSLSSTWFNGQSQTFTINCPIPTYVRNKSEVAFVGFIQDDGDQKVWQTALCEKVKLKEDAKIVAVNIPTITCGYFNPIITVKNTGINPIYAMNIAPIIDGIEQQQNFIPMNLQANSSTNFSVPLNYTTCGSHNFSINIKVINTSTMFLISQLYTATKFLNLASTPTLSIIEGFEGSFPPMNWYTDKTYNQWTKDNSASGFNKSSASIQLDCLNNQGVVNEFYLPPVDLSVNQIIGLLHFDYAYALRNVYPNIVDDSLCIFASVNCGDTWIPIFKGIGQKLITYNVNGPYTSPRLDKDWKSVDVNLNGLNYSNVIFRIHTRSAGNGIFHLDNINIYQNNVLSVEEKKSDNLTVKIFPNPSNSLTSFNIRSEENTNCRIQIFNAINELVFEKQTELFQGENSMELNLGGISDGIYIVKVETNKFNIGKKLIIEN